MNHYFYEIYGLRIRSTEAIDHLIAIDTTNELDVKIEFEEGTPPSVYPSPKTLSPIYSSYGLASNGLPYLTVWKQHEEEVAHLVIRFTNGKDFTFFIIDKAGNHLKVWYHSGLLLEDIFSYVLGPVIGCILRLKNKICLHASVVNVDNQAIAFIGEKTAGKSTLVATLAQNGVPVLSDDVAVLYQKNGQYYVQSGYPRLRLWKKTIDHLENISLEFLQRVLSSVDKYYLPLSLTNKESWFFWPKPLPLRAIYHLTPRNEEGIIKSEPYSVMQGFLTLKKNIYAEYMVDENLKRQEFEVFGAIARNQKVRSLDRPNNLSSLDKVCQLIRNTQYTLIESTL